MEESGAPFFERVRQTYLSLAEDHPDRVLTLDGRKSVETLHAAVLADALRQSNE